MKECLMAGRRRAVAVLLSSVAVVAASQPAGAQTVPSSASEAGAPIQDIVVTAQRRAQTAQHVPISMAVVSADELEQRSSYGLEALTQFTPNLNIAGTSSGSPSPNVPSIYIRGIGQYDTSFASDPGVGIYVDGVYVARSVGGVLDLPDVAQVEVLRGPQGTLFGKNSTGGALNITTRRAGNAAEGALDVTGGRFGLLQIRGRLSGPLSSNLFAKAAVQYRRDDGYARQLSFPDGQEVGRLGKRDDVALRVGLRWNPTTAAEIDATFDYANYKDTAVPAKALLPQPLGILNLYNALVAAPAGVPLGPVPLPGGGVFTPSSTPFSLSSGKRYDSYETGYSPANARTFGATVNAKFDLGSDVSFKSISGYRDTHNLTGQAADGTPLTIVQTLTKQQQWQFSQEFQLYGTALNHRLDWIAGAYYLHEKVQGTATSPLFSGFFAAVNALPAAIVPLAPYPADANGVPLFTCPAAPPQFPCAGGAGNPVNYALDQTIQVFSGQTLNSFASYAQATYKLTPELRITGGIRYTYEKKDFFYESHHIDTNLPVLPLTNRSDHWNDTSFRAGVDYDVARNILIYATVSSGFKSGGFNARPVSISSATSFNPEKVTNYEVGWKSNLFGRKLRFNAAIFRADYKDQQFSIGRFEGGQLVTRSINGQGTTKVTGVEADLLARPTSALSIDAGIAYLDTKVPSSISPVTNQVEIGNTLPKAPRWQLNFGGQYNIALAGVGTITPRIDFSYRSKTFNDPADSELIAQSGYSLVNARIGFVNEAGTVNLAVFVHNVFDKRYILNGLDGSSLGLTVLYPAPPRTWGITASTHF